MAWSGLSKLLHYYALTADANDSVGSAHLTNVNSVTFSADGAQFTRGSSQRLTVADNVDFRCSTNNTITCSLYPDEPWGYPTSAPTKYYAAMFSKWTGDYILDSYDPGNVGKSFWSVRSGKSCSTTLITQSAYNTLCASCLGASGGAVSINGGTRATFSGTPSSTSSSTFYLGSDGAGGGYWSGRARHLCVFSAALTTTEESELHTANGDPYAAVGTGTRTKYFYFQHQSQRRRTS